MAKGKKTCSSCHKENGARAFTCKHCNVSFASKTVKKVVVEEIKKVEAVKTVEDVEDVEDVEESVPQPEKRRYEIPDYVPTPRLTACEHAERIIGYGRERATNLFKLGQWEKSWSHVDWSVVEAYLAM